MINLVSILFVCPVSITPFLGQTFGFSLEKPPLYSCELMCLRGAIPSHYLDPEVALRTREVTITGQKSGHSDSLE